MASFVSQVDGDIQKILEDVRPCKAPDVRNQTNVKGILNSNNNCNVTSENENSVSSEFQDDDDDIDDDATDDSDTSSKFAEMMKNETKNTNTDAQWLSLSDKKDILRLKVSKLLFICSILLVGAIVCALTYWLTNKLVTSDGEESVSTVRF
jgi:hypothetical protein